MPRPGRPSTNWLGVLIMPLRNQLIGSQHTVLSDIQCGPSGTPTSGSVVPAENGHSPHTCTLVPRYSGAGSMTPARPPPGPGQPRFSGSAATSRASPRRPAAAGSLASMPLPIARVRV